MSHYESQVEGGTQNLNVEKKNRIIRIIMYLAGQFPEESCASLFQGVALGLFSQCKAHHSLFCYPKKKKNKLFLVHVFLLTK